MAPASSAHETRPPRLVSDTSRTYAAVSLTVVVIVVISTVYQVVLDPDMDRSRSVQRYYLLVLLVAYLVLLGSYQVLTWWRFRSVGGDTLQQWARATAPPPGRRLRQLLLASGARSWSVTAAFLAMGVALVIAGLDAARSDSWVIGLSLVLVALAWTNVVVAYAVAYLREHAERGGLGLHADEPPTWSDLVYLSVQVSTTFSSSDVDIRTRPMRRLVTSHAVVAFVFNTVIVAVLVSSLLTLAG